MSLSPASFKHGVVIFQELLDELARLRPKNPCHLPTKPTPKAVALR